MKDNIDFFFSLPSFVFGAPVGLFGSSHLNVQKLNIQYNTLLDNLAAFFSSSQVFPGKKQVGEGKGVRKKNAMMTGQPLKNGWEEWCDWLQQFFSYMSDSVACWLLNTAWIADEPFSGNGIPLVSCSNH